MSGILAWFIGEGYAGPYVSGVGGKKYSMANNRPQYSLLRGSGVPIRAKQVKMMSEGATRVISVDFTDELDTNVSLTGTPTVAEVTTTDLTLANKAVNTATYVDDSVTVAIGKAVQFTCTGGNAGTFYTLRITVSTDGTPAETMVADVPIVFV